MALDRTDKEELSRAFQAFADTRDPAIRDQLIEAHLGLAEYLARRFANRGEPLDDLVQVASLGLVKAVERFDPSRGLEFTTFATPTIVGELKRHFRDKGWAVRVPRRIQELHLRVTKVIDDLSLEMGRSPLIPEIAQRAGITEDEVIEAIDAGSSYRSASLDAGRSDDEESPGLLARAGGLGQLGGRGPPAMNAGQPFAGLAEVHRQVVHVVRDAHRPRRVAVVALELAEDRRHRVA